MSESLTLSTAGTSLVLSNPSQGIDVRTQSYPKPDRNVLYAQSIDTEGGLPVARAYNNRDIPLTVRCFDVSPGDGKMDARLKQLQQVVGRIQSEGCGTLTRVTSSSGTINFDALDVDLDVPSDFMYSLRKTADCPLAITAKPLGYGVEGSVATWSETTLPVLRGTVGGLGGDVSPLGRLVVNNDQAGQDQRWFKWGMRSRYYDSAATAALFFEAETRLLQGGATLAARTGASGGTVARQGTLTTAYLSMMSLASSGTAYCSHVGNYEVLGRVYDPGGTAGRTSGGTVGNVTLALEWAAGDFLNVTRNDAVSPPVINDYSIVSFGQVHLPKVASGTQRWDGHIIAKGSGTNQSVDIDCVWLVPVDEGSGEAVAGVTAITATSFSAQDSFAATTAGGTLNGRTAPTGGAWTSTAGAASDYTFSDGGFATGSEELTRATSGEASTGRFALLGTATYTNTQMSLKIGIGNVPADSTGVLGLRAVARYTDTSNYVVAGVEATTVHDGGLLGVDTISGITLVIRQVVGGVSSVVASKAISGAQTVGQTTPLTWVRLLNFTVDSAGVASLQLTDSAGNVLASTSGNSSALAGSGALASGRVGINDANSTATAVVRYYDDIYVSTAASDAVAYAQQSLELSSDRIRREDSSGAVWARPYKYEGKYLKPPQSGQEARTAEFILKLSRGDPAGMSDSGIDDLSAILYVTPRYLVVPEG